MRIISVVIPACFLLLTEAKRAELRPRISEPQVYYEEDDSQAAEDDFNPAIYQPRTRALPSPRSKESLQSSKPPPVQTIRNYNKVNDDGSFTFGYEAADGSFKEETRGTDCVVRGKYGYIDPDGNKREFTYVSGNPCDPNAPKEDDDDLAEKQEDDDISGPANYPSVRPLPRPVSYRPAYQQSTTARAPTTIFQNEYQLDDDASQELSEEDIARPTLRTTSYRAQQPAFVSAAPASPLYEQSTASPALYRLSSPSSQYQSTASPALRTQPSIASPTYQALETTTRRPVTRLPKPQSVAITPRPHVAQVAAQYATPSSTQRSALAYTRPAAVTVSPNLRTTTAATASHLDFAAELERYVNTVGVSPSPKTAQASAQPSKAKLASQTISAADPIYQSELVYDPSTGQYNTQLYQSLPQTAGDFSLSHKLQPFVAQPQSYLGLQQLQQLQPQHQPQQLQSQQLQSQQLQAQQLQAQQLQAQQLQAQQLQAQQAQRQSGLYKQSVGQVAQPTPVSQPQEVLYRKQQSQLLQQSQQLYAQQQQRQQQQQQRHQPSQAARLQLLESQSQPQSFYYVAPSRSGNAAGVPLSVGQIDQYLRASAAAGY